MIPDHGCRYLLHKLNANTGTKTHSHFFFIVHLNRFSKNYIGCSTTSFTETFYSYIPRKTSIFSVWLFYYTAFKVLWHFPRTSIFSVLFLFRLSYVWFMFIQVIFTIFFTNFTKFWGATFLPITSLRLLLDSCFSRYNHHYYCLTQFLSILEADKQNFISQPWFFYPYLFLALCNTH